MVIAFQILGLIGVAVVDLLLVVIFARHLHPFRQELGAQAQSKRQADMRVIESVSDLFEEAI